jgi:ATP-dependent exoDNAse (exonuclease V) alpha subunit
MFKSIEGRELYHMSISKTEQTKVTIDEYSIALATLRTYKNAICILGPGGCGKTHLIKEFLAALSPAERAATLIVAPTGKAADNLNAQTIHKAFQFPNEVQPNEDVTAAPKHLYSISRIIIDEINMVRQDVFSRMIKTIRFVEQQTQKKVQVIILGDFGQISPVTTASDIELLTEFYPTVKGVYAFHSEQWEQMNFRKIVLKHIYRQEDSEFKEKLNEIKYGNTAAIRWFNEKASPFANVNAITICPTNKLVDYYNKEAWCFFDPDYMVEYTAVFKNGCYNDELPCPDKLLLSAEMRVMTVCNGEKYKNGSIGTIIKTNENSILVQFDDGSVATVSRHRFILQDGVVYEQIPVVLAYAITANKSEGMTFTAVNIVPGFFAPGQLYTALSRCTSIDGIYIDGELTEKDLHIDIEALRMTVDEA